MHWEKTRSLHSSEVAANEDEVWGLIYWVQSAGMVVDRALLHDRCHPRALEPGYRRYLNEPNIRRFEQRLLGRREWLEYFAPLDQTLYLYRSFQKQSEPKPAIDREKSHSQP